ncbi:hypothetical protein A0H81_01646 [Grifola frondosa]|uniref:Uncharacterized protein n=1 Tax=Grifola frondosa TaxID=5627 RepID=A0A1C7MK73_GRIFR|nr:hypothetical protein A0H81_01646 [Grifola frondosa]
MTSPGGGNTTGASGGGGGSGIGQKIKGAAEVVHGMGDTIRGQFMDLVDQGTVRTRHGKLTGHRGGAAADTAAGAGSTGAKEGTTTTAAAEGPPHDAGPGAGTQPAVPQGESKGQREGRRRARRKISRGGGVRTTQASVVPVDLPSRPVVRRVFRDVHGMLFAPSYSICADETLARLQLNRREVTLLSYYCKLVYNDAGKYLLYD